MPSLGQLHDRLLDLGDDRGLDALGRFVEDEQLRLGDQGPGDRELLTLAAGEQTGLAGGELLQRGEARELLRR